MDREEIISEIIKHELEITRAVMNGHRPTEGDIYHERRIRVKYLRDLLKDIESK